MLTLQYEAQLCSSMLGRPWGPMWGEQVDLLAGAYLADHKSQNFGDDTPKKGDNSKLEFFKIDR